VTDAPYSGRDFTARTKYLDIEITGGAAAPHATARGTMTEQAQQRSGKEHK